MACHKPYTEKITDEDEYLLFHHITVKVPRMNNIHIVSTNDRLVGWLVWI